MDIPRLAQLPSESASLSAPMLHAEPAQATCPQTDVFGQAQPVNDSDIESRCALLGGLDL